MNLLPRLRQRRQTQASTTVVKYIYSVWNVKKFEASLILTMRSAAEQERRVTSASTTMTSVTIVDNDERDDDPAAAAASTTTVAGINDRRGAEKIRCMCNVKNGAL